MLRSGFLWLSEQPGVFRFIKSNGLARKFASRFVAGEKLDTAVEAAREVNAKNITASLDLLGESVTSKDEAVDARQQIEAIIQRIAETGIDANVSIKLTQMGLDLDEEFAADNLEQLLTVAGEHEMFVRIDMESVEYVEPTLRLFHERFHPKFGDRVGVVIQSMIRRAEADIEKLVEVGARVRIVKGAYQESDKVAYPDKKDVDAAFIRIMEKMLEGGNYPAIATHDEAIIKHAIEYVGKHDISSDRFEFQMLYGVRRDLQERLRERGFNMRVYIPFGTQWYPYLMRRLAERPANLAFMVGNVVKEAMPWR